MRLETIHPTIEHGNNGEVSQGFGLTKREYFAIMVLQGISSLPNWSGTSDRSIQERTEFSVRTAELLIKELEK